jgi:hypothetical protein
MPRDPKPRALRRRRNHVVGAVKLVAVDGSVPPLPRRRRGEGAWDDRTRAWWEKVWKSPMASVYLDADVPGLARLAGMIDRVHRGEAVPTFLHQEIRQLEDRYGLSPLARRRLQWEIDKGSEMPEDARPAVTDDVGRWLRAVEDKE